MEQKPLAAAVVGVGRMGRHHARIYRELPEARLVAVVDPDPQRRETAGADLECATYPDLESLLRSEPGLQAVSIATPTVHHAPAALRLLEAGVACLVEKPLAASSEDAALIARTAAEKGVICQVGHTERFNPAVRAVAELGLRPRFIEVDRVAPMSFRSVDVGVVFDLMIHDLDIVLMMCGSPLQDVRAVGVSVLGPHEDVANARLLFEDGCVANLTVSRLAMKTERKLRVFSETSYITLDYARRSGLVVSAQENRSVLEEVRERLARGEDLSGLDYTQLVKIEPIQMSEEEPLKAELRTFLQSIRGGEAPSVDATAGWAAVDAAERVLASLKEHRWEGLDGARLP